MDHLVEWIIDVTIISVIATLGIVGVILGLIWSNSRKNDPQFWKDKDQDTKNQIKYYRDEVHRLNGSISKQRQQFQVDGEYNLDDKGDLASLAKSLLPEIVNFLPQSVQQQAKGLLNKPEIIDLLEEVHRQFPNEIKSLLGGFLKGGSQNTNQLPQLESKSSWKDGAA